MQDEEYKGPVCKGCWSLGNNCKICERCIATKPAETKPNPMQDEVKVSQADQEAFSDDYAFREMHLLYNYADDDSRQFTRWQMSVAMYHGMKLAEARHQAERDTLARMEPVAWMYERRDETDWFVTRQRCDENPVWTETPLYALPPAPEAGQ